MDFRARIVRETEEEERARLAASPEGSTNRHLSALPVRIAALPQDLLVRLPWDPPRTERPYTVAWCR